MTVPDVDTLMTYGGATQDYSPASDILRQRKSQYVNQELSRAAGMTVTAFRSFAIYSGKSSAPCFDIWDNGVLTGTVSVSSPSDGIYIFTWPSTVVSDIPSGFPGYSASYNVNIRASYAGFLERTIGGLDRTARSAVTSSTTVTVFLRDGATRALTNLGGGSAIAVWII